MSVELDRLLAILPPSRARGEWQPVTDGESGAVVLRCGDGARYAKLVAAEHITDLEQERDRVEWLHHQGIPSPRVLDWSSSDIGACLITSAITGVSAASLPPGALAEAWEAISRTVQHLHHLPVDRCPFTRSLTEMMNTAYDVVARGMVNPAFLPVDQQQTPPETLLARLTPQLEHKTAQEAADAVVCHGDLCLPNIILDPATWEVTGFIDLGRLGIADPYADIALLLANARETWLDENMATNADEKFARTYGIDLDRDRQQFYLHLDPLTWG